MARDADDPVGSMGTDTLPLLSDKAEAPLQLLQVQAEFRAGHQSTVSSSLFSVRQP
jgi:hypothetical protein